KEVSALVADYPHPILFVPCSLKLVAQFSIPWESFTYLWGVELPAPLVLQARCALCANCYRAVVQDRGVVQKDLLETGPCARFMPNGYFKHFLHNRKAGARGHDFWLRQYYYGG
ncbi:MAG: hypothetical protein ACN4GW_01810, partial [Desulforhopalus sp.]